MAKKKRLSHTHLQRIVAMIFVVLIVVSIIGFQKSTVAASISQGQRLPVLLFGIDAADASQHTDTLILGIFDPLANLVRFIFVPRDSRIKIPGYRFRRINEIYGYHMRKKRGREKAASHVLEGIEHLLSSDQVKLAIPNYIQVDYNGFRKMIDLLGGVWVRVKTPMHYDDHAGNYHFHKEPGLYLMDGDESLHYVRFRGATGDRGRILRQQQFLRNMAKRIANPLNLFRFPKMVGEVVASIHTNFSLWDLVYLAYSARTLRRSQFDFYILPGKPKGPYYYVKQKSAQNLAQSLFLGKPYSDEEAVSIAPLAHRITVKVWNASGKKGMAYQLTRYLRRMGFDVVDWGNYTINQVPTRVIDRSGKIVRAQSVADVLRIESVHSEPNPKTLADVEVIIGKNFTGIDVNH